MCELILRTMENANTEASKQASKPAIKWANEQILYGKQSVDESTQRKAQ